MINTIKEQMLRASAEYVGSVCGIPFYEITNLMHFNPTALHVSALPSQPEEPRLLSDK